MEISQGLEHEASFWGKARRDFFSVLAEAHSFDLKRLTTAEAQRLLNFVQLAEKGRYPEFAEWSEKVFISAKCICEQEVVAQLRSAGSATNSN